MFYAANLGKNRTKIDSVSCQNILSKEARRNYLFKGGSSGYRQGHIFFTWSGQLVQIKTATCLNQKSRVLLPKYAYCM